MTLPRRLPLLAALPLILAACPGDPCTGDNDCDGSEICVAGACANPGSSSSSSGGGSSNGGTTGGGGSSSQSSEPECMENDDCGAGYCCVDDICIIRSLDGGCPPYCETHDDCSPFEACVNGHCVLDHVCGNGTREGIEECDDGNLINNDGCMNDCTVRECWTDADCSYGGCINGECVGIACPCGPGYQCGANNVCIPI